MSAPKDMNFGHLTSAINGITNVETLAIVSKAVVMPYSTGHLILMGVVNLANGAGASAYTIKVYRGVDATGVLVYTSPALTAAANQVCERAYMFEEDLSMTAQVTYAITVTCSVNQAGNNITQADIIVWCL